MKQPLALLFRVSLIGCVLLLGVTLVHADSWPGFRGPTGDGVAGSGKPPLEVGADKHLRWKVAVPAGHSSPVVWGDAIFLTATRDKDLITLCLDRDTGRTRWEQRVSVPNLELKHRVNTHASSTPVTDGQRVYVYFGSFGLLAYDFAGGEVWRQPLPVPKVFYNQGSGTSPLLAEGKLILFVQIAADSHLLALDPATGREIWKTPVPRQNNTYATPIAWTERGRGFVGLCRAGEFTAYTIADGKAAWWVGELGQAACSTPVLASDRIILSTAGVQGEPANITVPPPFEEAVKLWSRDGEPLISVEAIPQDVLITNRQVAGGAGNYSLRAQLKGKPAKLDRAQWEEERRKVSSFIASARIKAVVACVRLGGEQDVGASHVTWRVTKGVPEVPSPLVWQGRVYLIRSGSLLSCIELETGKVIYDERIGSPNGYFASPVLANGCLYLASDSGRVTVVKAGDTCEILGRSNLGEPIYASPAIAGSVLYVRSAGALWAFGE